MANGMTADGASAARLAFVIVRFAFFAFVIALSGCNIAGAVGVAAYKIQGPPKIPAKYVPAKTPLLVLVENYQRQSAVGPQADLLTRQIIYQLETNGVGPVIAPEKLQTLRDSKPAEFPTMTITSVAQAVGAEQVMYVQLRGTEMSAVTGGEGYSGQTGATVKMIDAKSGATLWPTNMSDGYPVATSTRPGPHNANTPQDLQRGMYAGLSDQIAQLFYAWQPEDMSPESYSQ